MNGIHGVDTSGRISDGPLAERLRRTALAAAIYMAIAIGLLSPMASHELLPFAPDHANHVAMIVQARLALDEGQAPIRVAPWEHEQYRYPVYQFYSPLPYTIGAYVYEYVTPRNPFIAYKTVLWGALVLSGGFMALTARRVTRDNVAALLGGVVYMSAPYVLVNVHARGAFTEAVAQGVLAVVLYCSLRAYQASWRAPWIYAAAAAWASLALTHTITYLYGALFVGLFFALIAVGRRSVDRGLWRLAAAFGLGVLMAAYFLAPIVASGYLRAHETFGTVQELAWLTSLATLLSPVSMPPELPPGLHPATEHLHPNVGWPALAGVGLFLASYGRIPTDAEGRRLRRAGAALTAVFVLALIMVWSPLNFWAWLPTQALVVQFSYRLLTHVAWAGALLAACALAVGGRERLDGRHAAAGLVIILMAHASFLPRLTAADQRVTGLIERPRMGYGDGAYLVSPLHQVPGEIREWREDLPVIDREGALVADATVRLPRAQLRALGDLRLELEAHTIARSAGAEATPPLSAGARTLLVSIDEQAALRFSFDGRSALVIQPLQPLVAAEASPDVRVRLALEPLAEGQPGAGDATAGLRETNAPTLRLTRVAVVGLPSDTPVMPVREVARACANEQGTVACRVTVPGAKMLVQLPVLYYPDMIDVRIDGQAAPAFMVRTLAYGLTGVMLDGGGHDVRIRFRGLPWANAVSAIGCVAAVLGAALSLFFTRPRRRPMPVEHAPSVHAS